MLEDSYKMEHPLTIGSSSCTPLAFTQMSGKLIYTKTYTWMFIAVLFIIAKSRMQPKCLSLGEWINKQWYIQKMECYSALPQNLVIK